MRVKNVNQVLAFAVEPRSGTKHQRFLNHVREGLCDGDEAIYTYVLSWMARAVQVPNVPGEVAIVLRGRQGTGKSIFARTFGALFGKHFWLVSEARHIIGNFNAPQLRDCVVLFGDEAFWIGNEASWIGSKKHERALKALITENTFIIERKGCDAEVVPNYVHLIMASNEQWVVPASCDERRFLMLDVTATSKTCFGAIDADMKDDGLSNLLHALQILDISAFDHRAVPRRIG
jgi:phage/plasmid-associated DNA primase